METKWRRRKVVSSRVEEMEHIHTVLSASDIFNRMDQGLYPYTISTKLVFKCMHAHNSMHPPMMRGLTYILYRWKGRKCNMNDLPKPEYLDWDMHR